MLTKEQQVFGTSYIYYCVGKRDFIALLAFAYADDDAKMKTIKTYLTETVEPETTNELAVYQEKVDVLTQQITDIGVVNK